jgi:hypothetical protein
VSTYATAIHESSHLIVAASLVGSWACVNATVIPDTKNLGGVCVIEKCVCKPALAEGPCWCAIKFTAIDIAGGLAAFKHSPESYTDTSVSGDSEFIAKRFDADEGEVVHLMNSLIRHGATVADFPLAKAYRLAHEVLTDRWHHVRALADHLMNVQEMNYAALTEYFAGRQIGTKDWREAWAS